MSRTDRLITLVDRGLELCDEGDLEGAERQLDMARRIDPRHPEVVRLEATIASFGGDTEHALALFEKLTELVPDDATPWINAGELLLYSGDPEGALERLDRALELVDDELFLVDAVLLRVEALIALDRADEAREVLGELASSAIDDPVTILQIADAHLGAGDGEGALRWAIRLTADDEYGTDAIYACGCAYELLGDRTRQLEAWREVRKRDLEAPWPEWHLPHDEFEAVCEAALEELPARAKELLADVPMLVDDVPAEGVVAEGFDPRALGMIDGPNLREQSVGSAHEGPINIFLYQKNLELAFPDPDELRDQIRLTVLHETAHYFGLDEDEVAAAGLE